MSIYILFACFSSNVDFMTKKPKKCTKKSISQFATFTQLQSPKKFHALYFQYFCLKFSLENIEKCETCLVSGDCSWVKVANRDMDFFVHFLGFFGHKLHI